MKQLLFYALSHRQISSFDSQHPQNHHLLELTDENHSINYSPPASLKWQECCLNTSAHSLSPLRNSGVVICDPRGCCPATDGRDATHSRSRERGKERGAIFHSTLLSLFAAAYLSPFCLPNLSKTGLGYRRHFYIENFSTETQVKQDFLVTAPP